MKVEKYKKIAIITYVLVLIIYFTFVSYLPNPMDDALIKEAVNGFITFSLYKSEVIQNIFLVLVVICGIAFLITAWKNLRISLYLCVVSNITLFAFGFFGDSAIYVDYKIDDDLYKILGLLEGFIFSCVLFNASSKAEEKFITES